MFKWQYFLVYVYYYSKQVKNKYLIISDIHLGDKDCRPDILLKVLKKNKAKNIIIAGDLFDHHNLNSLKK